MKNIVVSSVFLTVLLLNGCKDIFTDSNSATEAESLLSSLVDECDMLVAHPDDPERMSMGVPDYEIVPRLAIIACEDAIDNNPDDPRFIFQLGRALLALGKKKEALEYFKNASEAGHITAFAYLGDAYQFGWGVEKDKEKSLENYKKAMEGNFEPAKSQIEQLTFDKSLYVSPSIFSLYSGDLASVSTDNHPTSKNYIFNFTTTLMRDCGSFLKPASLAGLYFYRYPKGWKPENDDDINVVVQTSIGEFDSAVFLKRHGCEGIIAKQLFTNMNNFFPQF